MSRFNCLLVSITCIQVWTVVHYVNGTILAGVTIESPPFLFTNNNQFSGLCVDVLEHIKFKTGLNYSLYLVEDKRYGPEKNSLGLRGLIGDVVYKKADFAIADLTVTKSRADYVSFTEPFFTFSISALVKKSLAGNLKTIDDLAIKSNLSIATFYGGNTLKNLKRLTEVRNIRWIYERIMRDEKNLIRNKKLVLQKVLNESYAFIQEEPSNSYYAINNCQLKVLTDQNFYVEGEYAIAFRSDSPYIGIFNQTLRKMKQDGVLERIKRRHFYNKCNGGATLNPNKQTYFLLITTMFWILALQFYL